MNTTEYLLSCLIEECAEVIQRATKAQRFGLQEVQPEQELTNEERLAAELADLTGVLEMLYEHKVQLIAEEGAIAAKKKKILKFMDYSRDQGCLHR